MSLVRLTGIQPIMCHRVRTAGAPFAFSYLIFYGMYAKRVQYILNSGHYYGVVMGLGQGMFQFGEDNAG